MSASREQRTKLGQETDVVIPRHISRVRRNVVALSENKFPPSHVPSATTQRDEGTWGFSIRLFGGGAQQPMLRLSSVLPESPLCRLNDSVFSQVANCHGTCIDQVRSRRNG